MTIGDFRGNFGNFEEIDPCRRLKSACLQTAVCKMEKIYETILSHEANCYILHNQQIAGQAHKRAVFYIVLFYMT